LTVETSNTWWLAIQSCTVIVLEAWSCRSRQHWC